MTDKQIAEILSRRIARGKKSLKQILTSRQNTIRNIVLKGTKQKNFMSSAGIRNKLYRNIQAEYVVLNAKLEEWTKKEVTKTMRTFRRLAIDDMPKGISPVTFGQFSQKYADNIINKINPSTSASYIGINANVSSMLQTEIFNLRAAVTATMAEGAYKGLSKPEMAQSMIRKVNKSSGAFKFVDKAGRHWKAENYFGMLNRTLHANTARDTYLMHGAEVGFDLYAIKGGLLTECDVCSRWAGKIISMTGATPGYPTYEDAKAEGMFHPNCVHFVSVVLPSEAKAEEQRLAQARKEVNKVKAEDEILLQQKVLSELGGDTLKAIKDNAPKFRRLINAYEKHYGKLPTVKQMLSIATKPPL